MAIESLVALAVFTGVLLVIAIYAGKHRSEHRHNGSDVA